MSLLKSIFFRSAQAQTHFPAHMVCQLRHLKSKRDMTAELFEISKMSCAIIVTGFPFEIDDEVEIQIGSQNPYLRGKIKSERISNPKKSKQPGLTSYRYTVEFLEQLKSFRHVEQL